MFTIFDRGGSDAYEGLRDTGRIAGASRQVPVPTTSVDTEWQSRATTGVPSEGRRRGR